MAHDNDQDRREAVRVDERCLFHWQILSTEEYQRIAADYANGIPLYSQEKLADIQMITGARNALARIREKDADLADFLSHLDTKINFLLKKMEGGQTLLDTLQIQDINLSAKGVGFKSEDKLAPDQIIEMNILLLPDYVHIYALGRVVASTQEEDKGKSFYRNSVEFQIITEKDRETLIRYNFDQQSRMLRQQRLQK